MTQDDALTVERRYMEGYCQAVARHLVPFWEVRRDVETRPMKDVDIEKAFDEFHKAMVGFGGELKSLGAPANVRSLHDTAVESLENLDDALIETKVDLDLDDPLDQVRAAGTILDPAVLIVGKFPPPLFEVANDISQCREVRLKAADLGVSLTQLP